MNLIAYCSTVANNGCHFKSIGFLFFRVSLSGKCDRSTAARSDVIVDCLNLDVAYSYQFGMIVISVRINESGRLRKIAMCVCVCTFGGVNLDDLMRIVVYFNLFGGYLKKCCIHVDYSKLNKRSTAFCRKNIFDIKNVHQC